MRLLLLLTVDQLLMGFSKHSLQLRDMRRGPLRLLGMQPGLQLQLPDALFIVLRLSTALTTNIGPQIGQLHLHRGQLRAQSLAVGLGLRPFPGQLLGARGGRLRLRVLESQARFQFLFFCPFAFILFP